MHFDRRLQSRVEALRRRVEATWEQSRCLGATVEQLLVEAQEGRARRRAERLLRQG